jgi:hypothetical protein
MLARFDRALKLLQKRVTFDLKDGGLDARIIEAIVQRLNVVVANTS